MSDATKDKKAVAVIGEEAAEQQLKKLMDSYDIDASDLEIENGPEWIASVVNRLERAVRRGAIEILDNGEVKHNLVEAKGDITTLTYRRMDGTAMKERDKAKTAFHKDCTFMGSLCSMSDGFMGNLDAVDISIMQRLGQLFMVV